MSNPSATGFLVVLGLAACGGSTDVVPPVPARIEAVGGTDQSGVVGEALVDSLKVRVLDVDGNATPGVDVTWSVLSGGGQVTPTTATTNSAGVAAAQFMLGSSEGDQQAQAEVSGLAGSPIVFTAHGHVRPLVAANIEAVGGNGQTGTVGGPLSIPLSVRVTDASGHAVAGISVDWSVLTGGGTISPTSSTNGSGVASAELTLGPVEGEQQAQAVVNGLAGSPVIFSATAVAEVAEIVLSVVGGGNNVPERWSSDFWVHGSYAYSGTWGFRDEEGNQLKVWSLGASGAPTLVGAVTVPEIGTVSDVQVSEDGKVLVLSGENGFEEGGIYLYDLSDPAHPAFVSTAQVGGAGVHTVTLSTINERLYAFAARNPGFSDDHAEDPALLIYDVTDPRVPTLVARQPFPERDYTIHDTYVRDGIAFAFVWNTGLVVYDVGNGIRGGSPSAPVEISRLITASNGVSSGPAVHNGWWFHNPVANERRYLFIGQEGESEFGSRSSGDIHVVDIADLANPREVAFYHLNGAGTHNFWMDEQRQILYAAYYNAGVVALDVSGTLSGDLAARELDRLRPGGAGNTFTWGVQLANGFLYAIDMFSGLWQLKTD